MSAPLFLWRRRLAIPCRKSSTWVRMVSLIIILLFLVTFFDLCMVKMCSRESTLNAPYKLRDQAQRRRLPFISMKTKNSVNSSILSSFCFLFGKLEQLEMRENVRTQEKVLNTTPSTFIKDGVEIMQDPNSRPRKFGALDDRLFYGQGHFKLPSKVGLDRRDFPLFPFEIPSGQPMHDRIWNQMRYVPHQVVRVSMVIHFIDI
ncbi:unnamed protein product [Protopolystoma xenopodis]|uniref:Uncharacterized protein n=1 Tax=Protopolystoma xenopodis TaxID=117903 RepID=A0A448X1X6_9PLAT|nr:unnamed protein product [Protopolystoma xenopodis]